MTPRRMRSRCTWPGTDAGCHATWSPWGMSPGPTRRARLSVVETARRGVRHPHERARLLRCDGVGGFEIGVHYGRAADVDVDACSTPVNGKRPRHPRRQVKKSAAHPAVSPAPVMEEPAPHDARSTVPLPTTTPSTSMSTPGPRIARQKGAWITRREATYLRDRRLDAVACANRRGCGHRRGVHRRADGTPSARRRARAGSRRRRGSARRHAPHVSSSAGAIWPAPSVPMTTPSGSVASAALARDAVVARRRRHDQDPAGRRSGGSSVGLRGIRDQIVGCPSVTRPSGPVCGEENATSDVVSVLRAQRA